MIDCDRAEPVLYGADADTDNQEVKHSDIDILTEVCMFLAVISVLGSIT